jgi:formimidoylglutamate deiminase
VAEPLTLPGFVDAHCHAFQRALRGRSEGADFWGWRGAMLALAAEQSPARVRADYVCVYRELLRSGYTAVGEFHYLGFDQAVAAADAAAEAGIELVLLHAAYGRGGLTQFRQKSPAEYLRQVEALRERGVRVGLAPHSVRACPRDWLEEIGRYAAGGELVLHVHACEQPREIEECLAEHGVRPIELLAHTGCLTSGTTVVHATHASDGELDLVAEAGARVCVCPTTEADLGDGYAPMGRMCERGIALCIGSDSNLRIDPLEELRELDGIARRHALRRDVISLDRLLAFGSDEGAAALGLESWPEIEIDAAHPCLDRVAEEDVIAALVHGCSSDVLAWDVERVSRKIHAGEGG